MLYLAQHALAPAAAASGCRGRQMLENRTLGETYIRVIGLETPLRKLENKNVGSIFPMKG